MEVNMQMAKDEGWYGKNGSKWKTMPQLMLRYRAASFFSSLNCPELTMGIHTREEIEDGNFKEYPMEDLQKIVQKDIEQNANAQEFEEVAEGEVVTEPDEQTATAPFAEG